MRSYETQPPVYSLICLTSFVPATSVTWRRGSEVIEGGVTTSITKQNYFNVLNVTEEDVYSCEMVAVTTIFGNDLRERHTLNITKTPTPAAPYITYGGDAEVVIRNNSQVQLYDVRDTFLMDGLRCHTDLNTTEHSGHWVAIGRNDDVFQETPGEGMVALHSLTASAGGNYRCEIDTAASRARDGPRDVVYVTIRQGG
jgi:hypothetical protein